VVSPESKLSCHCRANAAAGFIATTVTVIVAILPLHLAPFTAFELHLTIGVLVDVVVVEG
jgi:hypothetical protein